MSLLLCDWWGDYGEFFRAAQRPCGVPVTPTTSIVTGRSAGRQAGEGAGSTLGFFRGYKSITRTAFFLVWQEGIE